MSALQQSTLAQQLQDYAQEFAKKVPEEVKLKMNQAAELLEQTGIANKAVGKGQQAPNFQLPNVHGDDVELSATLGRGPVVLSFYRGSWCPYCNIELRALQQHLPEFKAAGATLITVSPQTPDSSLSTAEKNELEFEVLSDVGNQVAREYGLVFSLHEELRPIYNQFGINVPEHNGDDTYELPVPATYVIDQNGTVAYAFVNSDYRQRAEPAEILEALRTL